MLKKESCLGIAYFLLFYLAFSAMLPLCVSAQESTNKSHTLAIRILEEKHSSPIANATVSISGPITESRLSGSDGLVVFSNIPEGTYSVVAHAPNYAVRSSQSISLTGNTTIILLFSTTKAVYDYSPLIIPAKTNVFFNASASNSSGVITGYNWDFGDNTTGNNVTTNHIFTKPGKYSVMLTVTSTVGVATYTQVLTVGEEENNYTPLLLLFPIPFIIFLLYRRRKYYVVIQARVPPNLKHDRCPGDNSECENCDLTPC
jgi:hypothetical protein